VGSLAANEAMFEVPGFANEAMYEVPGSRLTELIRTLQEHIEADHVLLKAVYRRHHLCCLAHGYCYECRQPWPCWTRRLFDGA
jgi:hypothetical protein